MRCVPYSLCLAAALSLTGCWFGGKPKAQTAPPPAPVQVPRTADASRPPTPAKKTPAKRKPTASAPRAVPPAAIPPKAAETKNSTLPPPAEPPQHLGRILSAEEKAEYQSAYERSSAAARDMLKTLTGHQLAPDTSNSLARIRSFLTQAQEASSSDLPKAAQLAYRAEILARDLVRLLE
jgi:hypothetical protein